MVPSVEVREVFYLRILSGVLLHVHGRKEEGPVLLSFKLKYKLMYFFSFQ